MSALPPNPSLRHLKNEAKQLLRALEDGSREAAARVRAHLRRVGGAKESHIEPSEVSLQEAQHVVAREYGFATWVELADAVETRFERIAELSREHLEQLFRETEQRDLITALKDVDTATTDRLVSDMTTGVARYIRSEVELCRATDEEVRQVRQRILAAAQRLGTEGRITWPPVPGGTPPPAEPVAIEPPVELDVLVRPLEQLGIDEIRQALHGLARLAQGHGIQALDRVGSPVSSRFVQEALKITADGTAPDLILDTLVTRGQTMVRHMETRMRIIIEGAAATRAGDNPGVVAHKLSALYSALYDEEGREPEKTVEQVQARLRAKPTSRLSHHELAMLYVDLAWISRLGNGGDIAAIADEVDDDFLRLAIHDLADPLQYGEEAGAFVRSLEKHIEPTTRAAEQRYRLFAEGITALSVGKREADLDEAMADAMGGGGA